MNIGEILYPKYPTIDSFIVKSIINVVDGTSMDESRTHFLTSINIFCLFVETISNEKKHEKGTSEPMPHFNSNTFSESNKKKH
jgi:hypothetical protein